MPVIPSQCPSLNRLDFTQQSVWRLLRRTYLRSFLIRLPHLQSLFDQFLGWECPADFSEVRRTLAQLQSTGLCLEMSLLKRMLSPCQRHEGLWLAIAVQIGQGETGRVPSEHKTTSLNSVSRQTGEFMSATAPKHFDVDVLSRFTQTEEIEIDVPQPETVLIHPRTIWVVVVSDDVYVRSLKGHAGHWYQEARASSKAVVYLDGHPIPVRAVPVTDEAMLAQVSQAYRRKYADDPFMPSMLRKEVLPTTLRLEPQ